MLRLLDHGDELLVNRECDKLDAEAPRGLLRLAQAFERQRAVRAREIDADDLDAEVGNDLCRERRIEPAGQERYRDGPCRDMTETRWDCPRLGFTQ